MAGSSTPLQLPIIDFSKENLKPGTSCWDMVRREVLQALEEYGCFEAIYDKVSLELHNAVFDELQDLFNLPIENKRRFISSNKSYNGYLANLPRSPLYEAMAINGAVHDSKTIQSFTDLMWPEGNTNFCKVLHSYSMRISELEKMVKRMVFESFGVEKYFDSHCESTTYSVRAMKYEAPETNEAKLGVSTHFDMNFITILHQNQVDGLVVKRKDGEWIAATPSASSFVVMTGESLLAWSNGRLHCPAHNVTMSGNKARYSIGLFSAMKGVIQCPEEMVDDQHPLLFKPFEEISLLNFFKHEIYPKQKEGEKTEVTLKAFCGV